MNTDLTAYFERVIAPRDLRLSGAALYRKLEPKLSGTHLTSDPFHRIDGSTLIIQTSPATQAGDAYLVSVFQGKTRALRLPVGGSYGSYCGPWRRRGDTLVGGLYEVQGNWSQPCVFVLKRRGDRWQVVASREVEHEASGIAFVGDGVDRVRVSLRNYDFRTFSQPHAGPLLISDSDWRIEADRIVPGPTRLRRTPLYVLDRFVEALDKGDLRRARAFCAPGTFARAHRILKESGRVNHVTCPYSYEVDSSPLLSVFGEGKEPETFFEFALWRGRWRIAGFRHLRDIPKPPDL